MDSRFRGKDGPIYCRFLWQLQLISQKAQHEQLRDPLPTPSTETTPDRRRGLGGW